MPSHDKIQCNISFMKFLLKLCAKVMQVYETGNCHSRQVRTCLEKSIFHVGNSLPKKGKWSKIIF
jgi:hypothetical protein